MKQCAIIIVFSILGLLLSTGCQESDTNQIRRSRVIETENLQLKQDLKEKDPQIEKLTAQIETLEVEKANAQNFQGNDPNNYAELVIRKGVLGTVKREVYVPLSSPGKAPSIIQAAYVDDSLRRCEIYGIESTSDLIENHYQRFSEDNGKTWSALTPLSRGVDAQKQGENYQEIFPIALAYDPVSNKTIEMIFTRVFLGDPEKAIKNYFKGKLDFFDHGFYRLSSDQGRTWSEMVQMTYEEGATFNPANWADPNFLLTNQMYGGYNVAVLSNGSLAYAATIPVPFEDEKDRQITSHVPNLAGPGRVAGVMCFLGKWDQQKKQYAWTHSEPVFVPRRVSTRGLLEPAIVELKNGHLLLEMRGSNMGLDHNKYSGRKWISVSKDGGKTWSDVTDLRYDTGEQFYSPSAYARMIRSTKTGKLYWIGNISESAVKGNSPRYPFYIAEVDEDIPALKKHTLTVIDDRAENEPAEVQFSNFALLEDRQTYDLEIYLTRLGESSENTFSANLYKYNLSLSTNTER